jgi:hypothetical protein
MFMDKTGQQPGRRSFLEQRARLQASVNANRMNNTASRFNRLDETHKKVVFILANDAVSRVPGLPQLTRSHLDINFADLSEAERTSLMIGIKRLSEFAASMPWEFEDYAAPRAEMQALRDKPPEPDKPTN